MQLESHVVSFPFIYVDTEFEAEVVVSVIDGEESITVDSYYPNLTEIPDGYIIREYHMYRDTQMTEVE